MIVFERCDPTISKCKSEEKVKEWLKFRYLITIQNRKSFIQYEFGDKRINERAVVKFQPMDYVR